MKEKQVFFYLNADDKIGSGHFWRCLSIADELTKYNIGISFIYSSLSSVLLQVLKQTNMIVRFSPSPSPINVTSPTATMPQFKLAARSNISLACALVILGYKFS